MDIYSLDDKLQRLVTDELDRAERVAWLAQPAPRGSFPWLALPIVLFAIPWTLFALFWMAGTAGLIGNFNGRQGEAGPQPVQWMFALFGVPFVLIGLGMMSTPFWMLRRIRRAAARTAYVITDRRAIVIDGGYYGDGGMATMLAGPLMMLGRGLRIRSYLPNELQDVQRIQRDDGSGDILFGEVVFASETNGRRQFTRSGFFSISDVKRVEDMLKSLAAKPSQSG